MDLKVKRLSGNGQLPTKIKGNAAYDLYSAEKIVIPPLTRKLIKTGISIEIPEGVYGHISDRSGMAYKFGAHCLGKIIDPNFRGEICIVLYNTDKDKEIEVNIGDRPAQIVFKKYEEFDVKWSEILEESNRGELGWGASGR